MSTPHSRRINFQRYIFNMNRPPTSSMPLLRRAQSSSSSTQSSTSTSTDASSSASTQPSTSTGISTATNTGGTRHGILSRTRPDICVVCNVHQDILNCPVRLARLSTHQNFRDETTQTETCTCIKCLEPPTTAGPFTPSATEDPIVAGGSRSASR